MSLCVRYVTNDFNINERFLGFGPQQLLMEQLCTFDGYSTESRPIPESRSCSVLRWSVKYARKVLWFSN